MKWLAAYFKPYRARISLELIIKTVATLMDLCIPWILGHIIDVVIPSRDIQLIALWGALMIVCSIVCVVGNISANRLAASIARDTTMNIRHDLFAKTMSLSSERTDAFTASSPVSRITNDTYNINNMTDISFSLNKGESLGIIGATGSGKTTLINLLMRFYDADEGRIFIDGSDIRSYENDELRKKFGVVFQNNILFADSVRNNVDFGRPLCLCTTKRVFYITFLFRRQYR